MGIPFHWFLPTIGDSHRAVADRFAEYHELGVDHFIMSGQPPSEEAHWFAEGTFPVLRSDGLLGEERTPAQSLRMVSAS